MFYAAELLIRATSLKAADERFLPALKFRIFRNVVCCVVLRCELPGRDNGLLKGREVSESVSLGRDLAAILATVTRLHLQLFRVYLCWGAAARRRTKPDGPSRVLAELEFHLLLLLIDFPFPRSLSSSDPLSGLCGGKPPAFPPFCFLVFVLWLFLARG